MEVELEEECLKALALYQPVAIDLRYIAAVLKINNDLERIGDLAANIAERAVALAEDTRIRPPYDSEGMASLAQNMLKLSLDCLVHLDVQLARKVLLMDDEMDQRHKDNFGLIKEQILLHPEHLDHVITSYSIHYTKLYDHHCQRHSHSGSDRQCHPALVSVAFRTTVKRYCPAPTTGKSTAPGDRDRRISANRRCAYRRRRLCVL